MILEKDDNTKISYEIGSRSEISAKQRNEIDLRIWPQGINAVCESLERQECWRYFGRRGEIRATIKKFSKN